MTLALLRQPTPRIVCCCVRIGAAYIQGPREEERVRRRVYCSFALDRRLSVVRSAPVLGCCFVPFSLAGAQRLRAEVAEKKYQTVSFSAKLSPSCAWIATANPTYGSLGPLKMATGESEHAVMTSANSFVKVVCGFSPQRPPYRTLVEIRWRVGSGLRPLSRKEVHIADDVENREIFQDEDRSHFPPSGNAQRSSWADFNPG